MKPSSPELVHAAIRQAKVPHTRGERLMGQRCPPELRQVEDRDRWRSVDDRPD